MTVPWARLRDLARQHLSGIVIAAAMVVLVHLGALEGLEHWSLAQLFEWRGKREPTLDIVIVTIDESTIAEFGEQWPFPRRRHAALLKQLAAGKPRFIAMDIIFEGESARGEADDAEFADAVAAAGNVVLGAFYTREVQGHVMREMFAMPWPKIRDGAVAVAAVNMPKDDDGQLRRVAMEVRPLDPLLTTMPGLDATLHRLLSNSGTRVAPLPRSASVLINFRGGPRTYQWVSYHQASRNEEIPAEFWKDKIIFIGPTTEAAHDVFKTPFARGGDMPGVEIHANALETLVRGNPIHEAPRALSTVLAALAALLGCALVVRLHARRAVLVAVAIWVPLTAAAFVGFAVADMWMRGMAGSLALAGGVMLTVGEHFIREQRQRKALQQFFSPDIATDIVSKGGVSTSRRILTVLFSDIRGFTSLSEKLEPEQVEEILRDYLTEMTEIVWKHKGSVDNYIGDAIMALYNVPFEDPEHAINAVRTGLEFQERTLAVSRRWEEKLGIAIRNGVGINTGEAVFGKLGSIRRPQYTAIGDTVNLGARLESITKDYQANMIISESTYELVKDHFITKELGEVTVKGKTKPVKIYTVLPKTIQRHPRAAIDAAATLSIAGGGRTCTVTTVDISEGGMALKGVPDDWQPGQVVEIRCEGGALPKPLVAAATISWRNGDQVGVRFTEVDPDSTAGVADYVSSRTGGQPQD